MTVAELSPPSESGDATERFRLSRAGVLNVWQYDEQVFSFAGGRLLLRGANGAGKSKTLEMLLPFALDGDKARITASAKHHTSLLWLMTDGLNSGNRVGYVWVEFQRATAAGSVETFTCGVGIRASTSARSASAWHFVTDRRIGTDLSLEDEAGPLSMPRLKEVLGQENVFERATEYKAHVGRRLFGLDPAQYDEVLRLLYWLRQPQIGEDIEPAKLAQQLSQALPQLDEQAVSAAGDTFDELRAYGEQIERRSAASLALDVLANAYRSYARSVVAARARAVVDALRRERRLRSDVTGAAAAVEQVESERAQREQEQRGADAGVAASEASLASLRESPEYRNQRRLFELKQRAQQDARQEQAMVERHQRQAEVVDGRRDAARRRSSELSQGLADHGRLLRDLDPRVRRAASDVRLPSVIVPDLDPDGGPRRSVLDEVLAQSAGAIEAATSGVRRRLAAVLVVRQAQADVARAQSAQTLAEREAAQAEARWERARADRLAAEQTATGEESALAESLGTWAAAASAPPVDVPESLTDEVVDRLPGLARAAAEPFLEDLHARRARRVAEYERAAAEVDRLTEMRQSVEAERDPAPPEPQLPRTPRPDGLALWQVVDFADEVDHETAANVEAALQGSGLLDAWLRPGGRLLDADDLDVVLAVGDDANLAASTLANVLVPDLPPDSGLQEDDVRRVLAAIGGQDDMRAGAWVMPDGRWRLGPVHGRARKDQAQFIGATARAQERTRRLTALDAQIAEQARLADAADSDRAARDREIASLRQWVTAVPSGQALVKARMHADACRETEQREESGNREAQGVAHASRLATAQARSALERTAAEHELTTDATTLDAEEQQLRGLADALRGCEPKIERLKIAVERWVDSVDELSRARDVLVADAAVRSDAEQAAAVTLAAYESLASSVGDSVELIQQKISDAQGALERHRHSRQAAQERLNTLREDEGTAKEALRAAKERLEEHLQQRVVLFTSMAAVARVPGLLEAASAEGDDVGLVIGLAGHPASEPVARPVRPLLERLSGLSADEASSATTRVWRAHGDASNGPAGDHQPVVAEFGDLLAITGRDDAGESAIVALAARVAASVTRDRDLLTEREKQQFEQHVLGELGDAIRQCRRDADELVVAMNEQLSQVSTSQGIRVKLDWKLRDDVPTQVRAAVQLLAQPVGALMPEERATLRDVLHHLIEASRAEHPDLSYGEHLTAALDYRSWSEFTIRYTRPERPGQWDRLHRRSPLSQGEQKVLCYLPLFAAAAAHFTSLAGAAPHAPRLVLLDDAFPKIDARTHPLLFGLLVQLDLDFVVTSERLWGDHATVPSLAIYEALRDPSQRGIAQYEYRWDGRVLQGLG